MKTLPIFYLYARILALCALLAVGGQSFAQTDPLPSWNDGPAKKAIVEFVKAVRENQPGRGKAVNEQVR